MRKTLQSAGAEIGTREWDVCDVARIVHGSRGLRQPSFAIH